MRFQVYLNVHAYVDEPSMKQAEDRARELRDRILRELQKYPNVFYVGIDTVEER